MVTPKRTELNKLSSRVMIEGRLSPPGLTRLLTLYGVFGFFDGRHLFNEFRQMH
jgi:hypothetical protein